MKERGTRAQGAWRQKGRRCGPSVPMAPGRLMGQKPAEWLATAARVSADARRSSSCSVRLCFRRVRHITGGCPCPDRAVTRLCRGVTCAAWFCAQDISSYTAEQLQTVFMCSRETVMNIISRWPALASMNATDVLARLISLKVRPQHAAWFALSM